MDEQEVTVNCFAEGLKVMLKDSVAVLREAFRVYDETIKTSEDLKLSAIVKFEHPPHMKCGTIEDFHAGLEGRIGVNTLLS